MSGPRRAPAAAGVDAGASLVKLVVRDASGALDYRLLPADALSEAAQQVREAGVDRVGLTGRGGGEVGRLLDGAAESLGVTEFAAWGAGAAAMLEHGDLPPEPRHLLVSLGTGTSVMLADGLSVNRVGGTALGGGTVVGLGAGLLGTGEFAELAALAARGSRRGIDLLVSDIYRPGEIALAGDVTAASFGKLARLLATGERPADADLANAIMGLVGENVALICGGLAAAAQVRRVAFGGATLSDNPTLVEILAAITRALGREPVFLPKGEFAGAVGALRLVAGWAWP